MVPRNGRRAAGAKGNGPATHTFRLDGPARRERHDITGRAGALDCPRARAPAERPGDCRLARRLRVGQPDCRHRFEEGLGRRRYPGEPECRAPGPAGDRAGVRPLRLRLRGQHPPALRSHQRQPGVPGRPRCRARPMRGRHAAGRRREGRVARAREDRHPRIPGRTEDARSAKRPGEDRPRVHRAVRRRGGGDREGACAHASHHHVHGQDDARISGTSRSVSSPCRPATPPATSSSTFRKRASCVWAT